MSKQLLTLKALLITSSLALSASFSLFPITNSFAVENAQSGKESQKITLGNVQFRDTQSWTFVSELGIAENSKNFIYGERQQQGSILVNRPLNGDVKYADLYTKESYGDVKISFDFYIGRSTWSGLYIANRYRLNISDIYGKKNWWPGAMGGIHPRRDEDREWKDYDGVKASANAALAPGNWQSMSIHFRAPRFDENGFKTQYAQFVKVEVNGVLVQDNQVATGPSGWAYKQNDSANGPIRFMGTNGPIGIKNLTIEHADFSSIQAAKKVSEIDRIPLGIERGKPMLNAVDLGKNLFLNKGCKECHSVEAQSDAVKTGPSLYGVFAPNANKVTLFDNQESLKTTMPADSLYFEKALREPNLHIAIRQQQDGTEKQYLPIMPAFNETILSASDIELLYTYLLTLNPSENKGEDYVWQEQPAKPYVFEEDLSAELVGQYPRIVRVNIGDHVSGRAYHVGLPNRLNYSFDPRTLAIEKIWQGRFLSLKNEKRGRADAPSAIGVDATDWPRSVVAGLFQPIMPNGKLVDFSFKEPSKINAALSESMLAHKTDFFTEVSKIDAKFVGVSTPMGGVPEFEYRVGENLINAQFLFTEQHTINATFSFNNKMPQALSLAGNKLEDISVSLGKIEKGVWKVPAGVYKGVSLSAQFTDTPQANENDDPKFVQSNPKQTLVWTKEQKSEHSLPHGYTLENATPPKDKFGRTVLFEPLGITFNKVGKAFISTRTAGVWTVENKQWQQLAEGTFGSLGLVVESDTSVVVGEKPGLTRLIDADKDGWSERREVLSDNFRFNSNYHEYLHGPVKSKDGSYLFTLNLGHGLPGGYAAGGAMSTAGGYRGWAMAVDKDMNTIPFASGLRSPAGVATGPDGEIYYTDNQGDYFGTSKLFRLKQNAYYGHPAGLVDLPGMHINSSEIQFEKHAAKRDLAIALLPHGVAMNSPGSPAWDSSDNGFGPYQGQMFVGDQSQSNIFRVHTENINGVEQASLLPFMTGTASGAMRLTFSPIDNSMWIGQTGRGWWAKGGNLTALQRIVWNKQVVPQSMHSISINNTGFTIHFTQAVDLNEQASYKAIKLNSWYYTEDSNYGSAEKGKRDETVLNQSWSADGKALSLQISGFEIDDSRPLHATSRVYQFDLANTKFKQHVNGTFHTKAWYTVNAIPQK